MSDTVIKVEGLSKRYFIGHENQESYKSLRDVISNNVKGLGNNIKRMFVNDMSSINSDEIEEFWALDDLNFELKKGDTLGVIGRNGAGKSTLLKIISRVTEPTKGRVEINGRLASLLEVGTGFHPELTGRENIFLNGAILGMSRSEIKRKFDEIVDFSGVEKFLDTPVKRYSSGMYVRLAFAVAAHLESEILIVDEVLAVGDSEFQKKCLGKMNDASKLHGKTVLFVSHNMLATKQLCQRGIFLENGTIKTIGEINTVIDRYVYNNKTERKFVPFRIKEIDVLVKDISINKENNGVVLPFQSFKVDIELEVDRDIDRIGIQVMLSNENTSGMIFASNTKTTNSIDMKLKKGDNTVTCIIKNFNLASGKYWLGFGVDMPFIMMYFYEPSLIQFDVSEVLVEPRLLSTSPVYGNVYLEHQWSIK